ncbi:MAG: RNase adapter RapZ [Alphaproteobacteria bacterium]|nr:RNase adapter RapZ [Alphaproteobacteria bacterium]
MKLVLITGMSGAGKGVALKTLEDSGFEAIDNLPLAYLPDVAESSARAGSLAITVDIRSRDFSASSFIATINKLRKKSDIELSLVFLDCDDEVLRRRYTETRRRHPLAEDRAVMDGIHHERTLIEKLRGAADLVLDTSETEAAALRKIIAAHFASDAQNFSLAVTSFSFKRGVPREADMVFDVRFLKNPYYEPILKDLTGFASAVGKYIETDEGYADFMRRLEDFLLPVLPRYMQEGKHYLTIAVGCTGGRHRSVYVVEKLGEILRKAGYEVDVRHRETKPPAAA